MAHDIVYLLRNGVDSEELRYSLRSVQANFPYNRVWFVGGCPKDITPDVYIPMKQQGNTKWARSTSSLKAVCEAESLTEDFWLFNDDFFVLEPVNGLPYMYKGELTDRQPLNSAYMRMLKETETQLSRAGLSTLDYAIHVPMLINKEKALKVFERFPYNPMFRCLYGNYWQVGGERVSDVKIYDRTTLPAEGQTLCSTVDEIFKFGAIGKYIKERFPKPSKWECKRTQIIDAGKLLYKWGKIDGIGQWVVSKDVIKRQSTIDAIPIEWLKENAQEFFTKDEIGHLDAMITDWLIVWREENESGMENG